MARTGMTDLINLLRDYTVAGTNDYTLGTVSYWTDNQLQAALDRHKLNVIREVLVDVATYSPAGSLQYIDFYSQFGNYEATTGGTAVFVVEDGTGNAIGTSEWSMNYAEGKLTFNDDQAGSLRYITGSSYDVHAAAADIWQMKMGHHAGQAIKWSTDNMTMDKGGLMKNDKMMADYHSSQARVKTISFERSDTR